MNKFKKAKNEMMGLFLGSYDEVLANRENVKQLLAELIKDLPPKLSEEERKAIQDKDRYKRNAIIKEVRDNILKYEEEFSEKGLYDRMLYTAGLNNVIPMDNMEDYREGAERQEAINQALQTCEDRVILSKQEFKQWKNHVKDVDKSFQSGIKQALMEEYK